MLNHFIILLSRAKLYLNESGLTHLNKVQLCSSHWKLPTLTENEQVTA